NALLAHGIITRPTQDVDLFTNQDDGVERAAAAVEAALRQAGFAADRLDEFAGLADIFPGMGDGLAEWVIASPDGEGLRLQLTASSTRSTMRHSPATGSPPAMSRHYGSGSRPGPGLPRPPKN